MQKTYTDLSEEEKLDYVVTCFSRGEEEKETDVILEYHKGFSALRDIVRTILIK